MFDRPLNSMYAFSKNAIERKPHGCCSARQIVIASTIKCQHRFERWQKRQIRRWQTTRIHRQFGLCQAQSGHKVK